MNYYLIGEGKTKMDIDGGKVGEGKAAMAMFASFFKGGGTNPIGGVILSPEQVTFMKLELVSDKKEVRMQVYTSTMEDDEVAHAIIMKFCRHYCINNGGEVPL
jgi:hypothetical protein